MTRRQVIYTIEERRVRGVMMTVLAFMWHGVWGLTKLIIGFYLFLILFFFGISCAAL